jgi:hypothetical protein
MPLVLRYKEKRQNYSSSSHGCKLALGLRRVRSICCGALHHKKKVSFREELKLVWFYIKVYLRGVEFWRESNCKFSHPLCSCTECRTPFETPCFFTMNAAGAVRHACLIIVNCFHLPNLNDLEVKLHHCENLKSYVTCITAKSRGWQ